MQSSFFKKSELHRDYWKCIFNCMKDQWALQSRVITNQHIVKNLNPIINWTSWFHLFPCKRFHVLLNSLFKVLCNFPSRYLFAIGLTVIFSLRWSLPPTLGCTLKQPDSAMKCRCKVLTSPRGLSPSLVKKLIQKHSRSFPYAGWHFINVAPSLCVSKETYTLGFSLFTRRY